MEIVDGSPREAAELTTGNGRRGEETIESSIGKHGSKLSDKGSGCIRSIAKRKRRSKSYRSRRERRARFGELIQFDGSHHDWFEGRRSTCCLITMIDDATNIRLCTIL